MKNKIFCLVLCIILLMSVTCCTSSEEDTFPTFDFRKSNDYVSIENATLTMKFASEDKSGKGWEPNTLLAIYVSENEQPLFLDYDDEKVSDYKKIDGYTVVAEYDRDELGSQYSAFRLPFDQVFYTYSQEIVIPSGYLQDEQGVLHFYLCDVSGSFETGYMMLTLRSIQNVTYETKDGRVKFNFDNCVAENIRRS